MVRPFYWLYFVTSARDLAYEKAKEWLDDLLTTKWGALVPVARDLVGDRCATALELLR